MDIFKDKIILLTGGTGSFGNKFTEMVLKEQDVKAIRIFSRGEKKQLDMNNRFNDNRLRFFIGDVRDKDRLHRAMTGVDIVVHAAALKQVPACEYNPIEAVRTNVDGAININTSIQINICFILSTLLLARTRLDKKKYIKTNGLTNSHPPVSNTNKKTAKAFISINSLV